MTATECLIFPARKQPNSTYENLEVKSACNGSALEEAE